MLGKGLDAGLRARQNVDIGMMKMPLHAVQGYRGSSAQSPGQQRPSRISFPFPVTEPARVSLSLILREVSDVHCVAMLQFRVPRRILPSLEVADRRDGLISCFANHDEMCQLDPHSVLSDAPALDDLLPLLMHEQIGARMRLVSRLYSVPYKPEISRNFEPETTSIAK